MNTLQKTCKGCQYAARLYSSQAVALKNVATELEQDVQASKRRRPRSSEGPDLNDLVALRTQEFMQLRPPSHSHTKPHQRVEWYEQQFEKAALRIENAFTLKQLKKLYSSLQKLAKDKDKARGKSAIARYAVAHPAGWNWPTPEQLKARLNVTSAPSPDQGPQASEVVTVTNKELYLMYKSIQHRALALNVKLETSFVGPDAPIDIKLFGPAAGVTEMTKMIKNACKSITSFEFTSPGDVSLDPGIVQAIALTSTTYVEQTEGSPRTLKLWRTEKPREQSNEALDLLRLACAAVQSENQRSYFASVTSEAVYGTLNFHLTPVFLPKAPSIAAAQAGIHGLHGRISRLSGEYDRMGLPVAERKRLFSLSTPSKSLVDALVVPLTNQGGTLALSAVAGQLVFPWPTLDPERLPPPCPFEELVNDTLPRSRTSFIPSLPSFFLPFDPALEAFNWSIDQSDTLLMKSQMAQYELDGRAMRQITYVPMQSSVPGLSEHIEAFKLADEDGYQYVRVFRSEAAIYRPDEDNDILLVAEKRQPLHDLVQNTPHHSTTSHLKHVILDGTHYHLVRNRHSRIASIKSNLPSALPDVSSIPGASWQLIKSYGSLPTGEQSSHLQLHVPDVAHAEATLARVAETVNDL